VRLGAVGYLNARPLVYGLDLVPRFDVRHDVPSECARLLHDETIDVGLIPSIEYLRGGPYRIVPDLAIVSRGPVASVALYTTKPMGDVRSIAMDTSSRTSVALVRVLSARLFKIDPVGPWDDVELSTYGEEKSGVWASFPISSEYRNKMGTAASPPRIHVEHQQLDTTIEKNAHLAGKATTSFSSQSEGLRVVSFDLFPTLRVHSVTSPDAQPLAFIQEDKDDDPGFYVLLPKPLSRAKNTQSRLLTAARTLSRTKAKEIIIPARARTGFHPAKIRFLATMPCST
jgi:hypothetical protein